VNSDEHEMSEIGHSHLHEHGLPGGWSAWVEDSVLQVVLALVGAAMLATLVGVVALWPSGGERDAAAANAAEMGLGSERYSATVAGMQDQPCSYSRPDNPQDCRILTFMVEDGPNAGEVVGIPEINIAFDVSVPDFSIGERVVLGYEQSTDFYFYADRDRRVSLIALTALFAIVVVALGRIRGILALLAMALTLAVLIAFVAPSVLAGNDPVLVAVVAASAIACISLYLTHGFSPTTTVALAGTLAALGLTLGLSWGFFHIARFTGLATEEALLLPFVATELNVSALLLGGAIIGALGALDDVTVTQVSTVAELRHRSPELPTAELVASGIRVGRDHIASTVNTLLLAYAGASMPLLLLFAVSSQSLDMVANSELIAVEIVRTLCGSVGLVAAVPITTVLAAAVLRPVVHREPRDPEAPEPNDPDINQPKMTFHEGANKPIGDKSADDKPIERAPQWDDFTPIED